MSTQKQIDRLIAQRASEWVQILKTAGPAEHEAFVDWLRESRRHVAEFLTMVALDRELDGIDLRETVDREALLARLAPEVTRLQTIATPVGQTPRRPARRPRLAFAAAATIAMAVGTALFLPPGDSLVAGADQRAVELADGSVVELNAGSRVVAHLTDRTRELKLAEGEALFKVARDPQRPFRVRAGAATVEALGTQFNISAAPAGITVSVLEGLVRVTHAAAPEAPQTLAAGESVLIEADGSRRPAEAIDVRQVAAWRQKRLVFQKTPLEEVVERFNSHNVTPKLRLEGIEAGSRHYSATFDVDDPESFGDYLSREPDLAIERRTNEIVIRRARDAGKQTVDHTRRPPRAHP